MPTVILLDASLSMCRRVFMPEVSEPYELRHLAIHGLTYLLDHMNTDCKLEFVSLISYSSLWELIVQFTRDFDSVKSGILRLESCDKTDVIKALEGAKSVIMEEWGAGVPCQVLLVTDGSPGIGPTSLKSVIEKHLSVKDKEDPLFPLPFPFPCKLHVVCINNPSNSSLQVSVPLFQKLIDFNGGGGQVFLPEGSLSFKSVTQMFLKIAEVYYKPFIGNLLCGYLSSSVTLSPSPESYSKARDFDWIKAEMSSDIVICGFVDVADIASPPAFSRHLVLPVQTHKDGNKSPAVKQETSDSAEDEPVNEDGKQPSFCVLLHGSLKVENMVAICHLGGEWYGMLYSWADSKKKANLMLSAFEPGLDVVPWLGSLSHVGPIPEGNAETKIPTFPVKPCAQRSYSQNCVVWIKQTGLQSDIQKILRHARKLPEKSQHFYKELNRLRRAALSLGFYELLDGMATILDRECTLLPGSAHPDAALQLSHAASALRVSQDYNTPIIPLRTKFSTDD